MYSLGGNNTNFDMKMQIDPTAIASVLQRKKQIEIEAQQRQRQQNMEQLNQTIGMATTLASTMVQRSKDKQKADFIKSLGESLAATVPNKMSPVEGPTLDNSFLPPISVPDYQKQNLMRSAAQVDPDKAAEYAFKTANPGLTNQPIQFQRMTLPGSNGKPRQVSVGVLGNQMVNPFTKQPINMNNPADVDALPEYGFVQREEYAGTNTDGMPVFRNPVQGIAYTKDANGQMTPYNGPILPKLKNPSDAMAGKVQFISETRANLHDAIERFSPDNVGLIDKQYKDMGSFLDSTTDPKAEEFRNFIEEINITRRHEMFGSALTESEKKSFNDIALDRKLSPSAFMARLKALDRKLKNKENALMKSAKVSGNVFRDAEERPSLSDIFNDEE